jgi:hypothetical protein
MLRHEQHWATLPEAQRASAETFLREQSAQRHHIVVYLSGAHAYGFPSPDSDLDLKCVHLTPTRALVGLHKMEPAFSLVETRDGVELDYGTNEVGPVLNGVLRGNGNYIERLLGALALDTDDELMVSLLPLVRAALSRRVHRHYLGFAQNQRLAPGEHATAKRLLYVLRTTLTGTHLLRTGDVVTDLRELAPLYALPDVAPLIAVKQRGERTALDDETHALWQSVLDNAFVALDRAYATSSLPEEAPATATEALDAWLCEVRRTRW